MREALLWLNVRLLLLRDSAIFRRLRAFAETARGRQLMFGGSFALVLLAASSRMVHADTAEDASAQAIDTNSDKVIATLMGMLGYVLYIIVTGIIALNALTMDLVIRVAQHTEFVNARPVQIGWPLIRDVCNMFFIVVLLVVAFSTIIQYKQYNYKDVLPKLLLMAVLINFSKTIIGLLIDFSQVIMLTFVVGFKEAAFGNFAKALQVNEVLNVSSVAGQKLIPYASNIVIAELFGILLMSFAFTALLMMLIFLIARIVILWILLITSPLAFFAEALPGPMKSVLSVFTKDYWSRLSGALVGGPVLAFFLWLALAVVQEGSSSFGNIGAASTNSQEDAFVQATITEVGKPENVLNFVVAIAFLLTGLKAAVTISGQVHPKLGKVMDRVSANGGPLAVAGALAGRYAARKTGQAARAGVHAIDARAGLTKGIGSTFSQVGSDLGQRAARMKQGGVLSQIGALGVGAAAGAISSTGTNVGNVTRKRQSEAKASVEASLKGLDAGSSIEKLRTLEGSGSLDERREATARLAAMVTTTHGKKAIMPGLEAANSGAGPTPEHAQGAAAASLKREQIARTASLQRVADEKDDQALKDQVSDLYKKKPGMQTNYKKLAQSIANGEVDKDAEADEFGDTAVLIAALSNEGLFDASGKLKGGWEDNDLVKKLTGGTGNRAKLARAGLKYLQTEDGKRSVVSMNNAFGGGSSADAEAQRQIFSVTKDGNVARAAWTPGGVPAQAPVETMSAAQVFDEDRKIKDYAEVTGNLSPRLKTTADTAFAGVAGPARDAYAAASRRSWSDSQVPAAIGGFQVFQRSTTGAGYVGVEDNISAAQRAAIPLSSLKMYDNSNGALTAGAEPAIQSLYQRAFNDLLSADANEKTRGGQIIANTEVDTIRQEGDAAKVIVGSIATEITRADGLAKFKEAISEKGAEKRLKVLFSELARIAKPARSLDAGDQTDLQKAALKAVVHLETSGDKQIRAFMGRFNS